MWQYLIIAFHPNRVVSLTHSIHFCVRQYKMCPLRPINDSVPHPLSIQIMGFNGAGPQRPIQYKMWRRLVWVHAPVLGRVWGMHLVSFVAETLSQSNLRIFSCHIDVLIRVRLPCWPISLETKKTEVSISVGPHRKSICTPVSGQVVIQSTFPVSPNNQNSLNFQRLTLWHIPTL